LSLSVRCRVSHTLDLHQNRPSVHTCRKRFAQPCSSKVSGTVFRGVGRAILSQTHSPRQTQAYHTLKNAVLDATLRLPYSLLRDARSLVPRHRSKPSEPRLLKRLQTHCHSLSLGNALRDTLLTSEGSRKVLSLSLS